MTVIDLSFCGFLLSAIAVMGVALASRATHKTEENPSQPEPQIPPDDVAPLRINHNVRLVEASEEGMSVDLLPSGVYGFTYAPQDAAPLFQKKLTQCFEVHKLQDGEVHLVGYVTEEEATRLCEGNGEFESSLYPNLWGKAVKVVSIPVSRVSRARGPSREQGNALTLRIGPADYIIQ